MVTTYEAGATCPWLMWEPCTLKYTQSGPAEPVGVLPEDPGCLGFGFGFGLGGLGRPGSSVKDTCYNYWHFAINTTKHGFANRRSNQTVRNWCVSLLGRPTHGHLPTSFYHYPAAGLCALYFPQEVKQVSGAATGHVGPRVHGM